MWADGSHVMPINTILLIGRSLRQGVGKEAGKISERYEQAVSTCEMHPHDIETLTLKPGVNVRVSTPDGTVVLKPVSSPQILKPGVIFVPYGPYANVLTASDTGGSGMPTFKGLKAQVEAAPGEEVPKIMDLLQEFVKR